MVPNIARYWYAVLAFSFFNLAYAQNGDLAKLKLYRPYYTLQMQTPMAHQIEVYFQAPDDEGVLRWQTRNIAIQDQQDLSTLGEADFLNITEFVAGWLNAPSTYTDLPASLEHQRPAIEGAMKRILNNNNIVNVKTVYKGFRALVDVVEAIPIAKTTPRPGEDNYWTGRYSEVQLWVDLNAKNLERAGGITSGFGILFSNVTASQSMLLPWWNFVQPKSIEGSQLAHLEYSQAGASAVHRQAYQDFLSEIIKATQTLQQGGDVNVPLDTVLAQQGNSVLPEQFKQAMTYKVNIYGRTNTGTNGQLQSRVMFVIPLTGDSFTSEVLDDKSKLKFKLSGKLIGESTGLQLQVTDPNGNTQTLDLPIAESKAEVVIDGNRIMAPYFILKTRFEDKITMPGRDGYSSFDIYQDAELSGHPLVNPEIDSSCTKTFF